MVKITDINKCQTIEDLENLGLGNVTYDLGYRGGNLGFSGEKVADALDISSTDLSRNYGVYCNYLGGGVRGAICGSGYSKDVPAKKAKVLDAIAKACKRVYTNIENENNLNDEEDEDGETNWDALATKASRVAGVESAY